MNQILQLCDSVSLQSEVVLRQIANKYQIPNVSQMNKETLCKTLSQFFEKPIQSFENMQNESMDDSKTYWTMKQIEEIKDPISNQMVQIPVRLEYENSNGIIKSPIYDWNSLKNHLQNQDSENIIDPYSGHPVVGDKAHLDYDHDKQLKYYFFKKQIPYSTPKDDFTIRNSLNTNLDLWFTISPEIIKAQMESMAKQNLVPTYDSMLVSMGIDPYDAFYDSRWDEFKKSMGQMWYAVFYNHLMTQMGIKQKDLFLDQNQLTKDWNTLFQIQEPSDDPEEELFNQPPETKKAIFDAVYQKIYSK